MTTKNVFTSTCDCCGKEEVVENSSEMPKSWSTVCLEYKGKKTIPFEVCDACGFGEPTWSGRKNAETKLFRWLMYKIKPAPPAAEGREK